jgi:hypothetical protein
MVRDARLCRAPHHEGLASRRLFCPHPEEPRLRGVSKDGLRQGRSHDFAFPRHDVPESCEAFTPENREGAGKAGRSVHPQPRAHSEKHTSYSPRVRRNTPAFPAQRFTTYGRALPGVRDLIVTVACGSSPANLAPAQGRQDHTISPSARCRSSAQKAARSTLGVHCIPRPTFRDDWPKRPSMSSRDDLCKS